MELKFPRKPLWRGGPFFSKRIAFVAVAGLVLVVGIFLRANNYLGQPAEEEKAPATVETSPPEAAVPLAVEAIEAVPKTPPATQEAGSTPSEPAAEQAGDTAVQGKPEGDAAEHAEQPESKDSGMILVSRKPVEVLASPSASAPAMFGFPAGRPFRVIGREGGFAQIEDLRSGARGWIDEAALTAPPPRRAVAKPPKSKSGAAGRKPGRAAGKPKPRPTKKDAQVATDSDDSDFVRPRSRPGLFGEGGLFGGIFRGGN